MTPSAPGPRVARWQTRIARARALAAEHETTAELLSFYERLAAEQMRFEAAASAAASLAQYTHDTFPRLLDFLAREPNPEIRALAGEAREQDAGYWDRALEAWWNQTAVEPGHEFLARALLQPWAEAVNAGASPGAAQPTGASPGAALPGGASPTAAAPTAAQPGAAANQCPACGRNPQVAVLRPEFDSLRRRLVCSLCQREWDFRRILCPQCGETGFDKLPAFSAAEFPHLRVETCETCRTYLLAVDFSKAREAVPIVEDLAAVPLHFWAREQGYNRLQPNLFGL